MRSIGSGVLVIMLSAAALLRAAPAPAQCLFTGSAPIPESLLASKVIIKPVTLGYGNGDDRFKVLKGIFNTTAGFNPLTTDGLGLTLYRNNTTMPMLSILLPPVTNWTPFGSSGYKYSDPTAALGIRLVKVREVSPGQWLLIKIVGRDTSIANAPLSPGDQMEVQIEVDHGGTGDCFDKTLTVCTGTSAQQCH